MKIPIPALTEKHTYFIVAVWYVSFLRKPLHDSSFRDSSSESRKPCIWLLKYKKIFIGITWIIITYKFLFQVNHTQNERQTKGFESNQLRKTTDSRGLVRI